LPRERVSTSSLVEFNASSTTTSYDTVESIVEDEDGDHDMQSAIAMSLEYPK